MSRFKQWVEKIEVESEPGLTNTQLMLTNHDLRPGEKTTGRRNLLETPLPTGG
jgi:hypothetical protein